MSEEHKSKSKPLSRVTKLLASITDSHPNSNYAAQNPSWRCPEAFRHGPADAYGKCPWCGRKIAAAMPPPPSYELSDLTMEYGRHYDPDFGVLTHDQIRARYEMGQNS